MKNKFIGIAIVLACASSANAYQLPSLGNLFNNVQKAKEVIDKGKEVQQANKEFSEPEEIAVGASIASNFLGSYPMWSEKRAQKYVQAVGGWIAAQSERPDLPWHFGVTDDTTVNAFGVPGGYVLITKGMLLNLKSEAELAGILAHEVAHVVRKHHLTAIQKSVNFSAIAGAANFVMDQKPGVVSNDPRMQEIAKKSVTAAADLFVKGLDKSDEFEADRMAVVLLARAGYDPYAFPAALQTIQAINTEVGGLTLMFKTHPAMVDRLAELAKVMGPQFEAFERQPDNAARFRETFSPPVTAKDVTPARVVAPAKNKKRLD